MSLLEMHFTSWRSMGGGRHGESYVKSGSALPYEKKALKLYMYSCISVYIVANYWEELSTMWPK